jgi:hypothetical protein
MENQRRLQEKLSGDVARDRAAFLKRPPLAPERNPLLGRWRLDQAKKRPANALAELNAAISAPTCRAVFGDGIWDFVRRRCGDTMPASANRNSSTPTTAAAAG